MYENSNDRYNVLIGPKHGNHEFFNIATINGGTTVPGFDVDRGDCNASIINGSEGALYNAKLTHNSVLWYWRKALCRQVPLHFAKELQKGSLLAYKYELGENVYDRINDTEDCYKGIFHTLPDGLTDVSKCYYGNFYNISKCNVIVYQNYFKYKYIIMRRCSPCCIKSTFLWS